MKTKNHLSGAVLVLVLFVVALPGASAQYTWGIGLRLGDPAGITVKKYIGVHALELSLGRTNWWYKKGWYDRKFTDWYDAPRYGYKDFQYLGHSASVPLGIQLHYLFRKSMGSSVQAHAPGLEWYAGFGAQLRYQTVNYDYRYKLEGAPDWYYVHGDHVSDVDLGADGVVGLEYSFAKAPVSLFLDATLFMEIIDRPFSFWLQGGTGARFNF